MQQRIVQCLHAMARPACCKYIANMHVSCQGSSCLLCWLVCVLCVLQALMLQLPGVMELVPQMDEPDPELLWMVRKWIHK